MTGSGYENGLDCIDALFEAKDKLVKDYVKTTKEDTVQQLRSELEELKARPRDTTQAEHTLVKGIADIQSGVYDKDISKDISLEFWKSVKKELAQC